MLQCLATVFVKLPFIVPLARSISRRVTSTVMGLTPDCTLKNIQCPDGLLSSSRRKSCRGLSRLSATILPQERHFLPVINDRVSMPSK